MTTEHVKSYLTYLAVEKKVSASTQNLALNSLLFFYRHILNKDFGTIDGVICAKKRPYIRTIQELLGHSDVRTTMIYKHTVKSVTLKEAESPLDF